MCSFFDSDFKGSKDKKKNLAGEAKPKTDSKPADSAASSGKPAAKEA
jgi:hypothetical protein